MPHGAQACWSYGQQQQQQGRFVLDVGHAGSGDESCDDSCSDIAGYSCFDQTNSVMYLAHCTPAWTEVAAARICGHIQVAWVSPCCQLFRPELG